MAVTARRVGWLLLAMAGCYAPEPQVGLPCSPSGRCPDGQECAPDGTCQLGAPTPDSGSVPGDGAVQPTDAMPEVPLEPWLVSFQHPSAARASDAARVQGGFVLVGSRTAVMLDPRGEIRWQRSLGIFAGAVAGVNGRALITGQSGSHVAAMALDGDGDIVWQRRYDDQESSVATAVVAVPGTDHAVLVGNSYEAGGRSSPWLVRVDGAGAVVWQRRYTLALAVRLSGGAATADGGFVATGVRSGATLAERDLVVFKVDGGGDLVWQKRVSGGDNEWGTAVAETAGGELWVVGGTWAGSFGLADLWLLRLDADGAILSQHRIGSSSQDTGTRVFPTDSGGLLVVGETQEAGQNDLLVVEVKDGVIGTQLRVGSARPDYGGGAAFGGNGLVVFGDTDGFGDMFGFFAAAVLLPDGLTGCAHASAAGLEMATSSATASNLAFTVTPTAATGDPLSTEITDASLGMTAECR